MNQAFLGKIFPDLGLLPDLGELSAGLDFAELSADLSSGLSADISGDLIARVVEALVTAGAGALSATLEVILGLS